jgi:HEAT repeat protein
MGPLLGLLAAAVGLSVAYVYAYEAARLRARAWRAAADAVGLTETGLTGGVGLLRVALERYRRGRHEKGTRVVIDGLGHPSYEFALRKEGVGSAIEKAFGEREIELGDREFDRRAYIHGSPRVVQAVLDSETRGLVGELIAGRIPTGDPTPGAPLKARVAVSDGALRAEIPEPAFRPGGERLAGALRTLLAAAQRLRLPDDVPARLAENVRSEPVPAVRLANLRTLAREYPGYAVTGEALRAASRDPDDEVRLRAAIALGDDGRDVLRRMASSLDVADGGSARAVSALGEHLDVGEAGRILGRSLEAGRQATARAAVAALGRAGGPEVVEPLSAVLEAEDDELVVAAAKALGATGSAAAEAELIAALDRDGPTVWPAIAEALGPVGTAAAVAPLRTMASRFPFDLGLRRAARQAIAEIHSRLTGATPGQLALADGDAGRLSLAEENVQGRVSIAGEAGGEDAETTDGESHWPPDRTSTGPADPPSGSPGEEEEPSPGTLKAPPGRREPE